MLGGWWIHERLDTTSSSLPTVSAVFRGRVQVSHLMEARLQAQNFNGQFIGT